MFYSSRMNEGSVNHSNLREQPTPEFTTQVYKSECTNNPSSLSTQTYGDISLLLFITRAIIYTSWNPISKDYILSS